MKTVIRTVLITCARRVCTTDRPGEFEAAVRELAATGGWEALLAAAAEQGMAMLLTQELHKADLMHLAPADVHARYLRVRRGGVARALIMSATLIRTLDLLASAGIRAMPWKGPILGQAVYGDVAARHFADLDVLVYPADAPRAIETLKGAGWLRALEEDIGPMDSLMRTECELPLVETGTGTVLEVHWGLDPPAMRSSLDVDTVWKSAFPLLLLGRSLPCAGPADTFVGLAVHAARHGWLNLEQACSLGALVIAHPETDWAAVVERSRMFGCYRRCLLGAVVIHDLLAIPMPDDILRAARSDRGVRRLAARVCGRWKAGGATALVLDPGLVDRIRQQAWKAATFDRRGQGAGYMLGFVFNASMDDRTAFALPRPLEHLYLGLRPARLLWKHGRRALRRPPPGDR